MNLEKSKRVFGYTRVSTGMQANDGDSLDTQEQKIKDYCKSKNLELISIHREEGVSGAKDPRARPQLSSILSKLDAKLGEGLVCTKIDRLSRSTKDFLILIDEFKKKKIKFYCITPEIDAESTMGQFTMNLLSIISQLERSMTSDRVKEVFAYKKSKNELIGSLPFGKKIKPNENPDIKILEDDEEEQETIRIVKELRNTKFFILDKKGNQKEKKMTLKNICEELTKQNRLNKDGKANWYPEQIRRILHDGKLINKKK